MNRLSVHDDLTAELHHLAGSMVRNGHYDAGRHIASLAHGEPEPMARKPRIITEIVQYLRNVAAYLEARPLTSREFRAETGRNADDIRALAKELDTRYDARSLNLEPTQRAKRKTKSASTKKAAKRAATR